MPAPLALLLSRIFSDDMSGTTVGFALARNTAPEEGSDSRCRLHGSTFCKSVDESKTNPPLERSGYDMYSRPWTAAKRCVGPWVLRKYLTITVMRSCTRMGCKTHFLQEYYVRWLLQLDALHRPFIHLAFVSASEPCPEPEPPGRLDLTEQVVRPFC